jgi:hypothetical protein
VEEKEVIEIEPLGNKEGGIGDGSKNPQVFQNYPRDLQRD